MCFPRIDHIFYLKECQLNAANLMKSELDFDDDYTMSPKLFIGKR